MIWLRSHRLLVGYVFLQPTNQAGKLSSAKRLTTSIFTERRRDLPLCWSKSSKTEIIESS